MKIVNQASTGKQPEETTYLESYDPNFVPPPPYPRYPSGLATWTTDPAKALKFDSTRDAYILWFRQSSTVPYRPDGRPNKPLCGFTVAVDPVGELV